jgi:hypothetical protein
LAFANILIFAPPGTQANRRAAVAQRRYATASRRFRSDCLRPLPPLRTLPPEWERRAGSSQRSRQNAPLGRKRHLPRILWLPTPRLLADIESLTSSFCRRRRCRISRQQSTWLSYRAGRLLAIRKKERTGAGGPGWRLITGSLAASRRKGVSCDIGCGRPRRRRLRSPQARTPTTFVRNRPPETPR